MVDAQDGKWGAANRYHFESYDKCLCYAHSIPVSDGPLKIFAKKLLLFQL
jgi:hypothetical protein